MAYVTACIGNRDTVCMIPVIACIPTGPIVIAAISGILVLALRDGPK